jgi:hypothetical protein
MLNPGTLTKTFERTFENMFAPTNFFSGMAVDNAPTNALLITMDIVRGRERIAVDVKYGTGANKVYRPQPYTNKTFQPPEYNEKATLTADELFTRLTGKTEYTEVDWAIESTAILASSANELKKDILRAIEWQGVNAFITGTIPLINNATIDFHRKTSHAATAATSWSTSSAAAMLDIELLGDVIRADSGRVPDTLIFGQGSLDAFLANDEVQKRANFRRVDYVAIKPPSMNSAGATFHGVCTIGSYNYEIWTYPQVYEVPMGFGLPNEGEKVKYVPDDVVIVTCKGLRADIWWGGLPRFADGNMEGAQAINFGSIKPTGKPVRYAPYVYCSKDGKNLTVGLRSRPMFCLTEIDAVAVLNTDLGG